MSKVINMISHIFLYGNKNAADPWGGGILLFVSKTSGCCLADGLVLLMIRSVPVGIFRIRQRGRGGFQRFEF